jgi:hypothetical protein
MDPRPTALSTSMIALCHSAMHLAMARPNPAPLMSRVRALSARQKPSNGQSSAPGGVVPDTMPSGLIGFNVVIVLKSGLFKGRVPIKQIKLSIQFPSNRLLVESSTDVFFEGDDRG